MEGKWQAEKECQYGDETHFNCNKINVHVEMLIRIIKIVGNVIVINILSICIYFDVNIIFKIGFSSMCKIVLKYAQK